MIKETNSSEETFSMGESLGRKAAAGQVYTLTGDLGVGKTVFAQGFAAGLGISEYVNSPTFTILQVYEDGRLPLYHFDVYRIEEPEEMEEIGYEDYFYGDGVTLIEWADIIKDLIPEDAIRVKIGKDLTRGTDYRRISIENI
ncbi:MAG: tRNA (adenosine(37)-N6)-threonylcarbamoyltransferase complex ATPase subunit type 1 TsaE [Lachnospiraceae bacterium]|nr:tRNA (adenosine(37)-N6)-threonylcarbamoyltransferase complex ATPase subunit type 1 TsaE [Lachnospiraceae bacterium]